MSESDAFPASSSHATRTQPAPAAGEGAKVDGRERLVVIGITGKARAGKDRSASALAYHRDCFRVALADGVRSAVRDMDGPGWELTKELAAVGKSARWALQTLGTEARLDANAPGLWIQLVAAKIRYLSHYHPVPRTRFVVSDVRFRAEVSMLRHFTQHMGGSFGVLRLTRPDGPALDSTEAAHVSETELETIRADREYENAGTVEELAAAAVAFFDDVAIGRVSGNF